MSIIAGLLASGDQALKGVRYTVGDFFMPRVTHSDDPLAQLLRQHPEPAARFIRYVLGVGGLMSFAIGAACVAFLMTHWEQSSTCARPLRLWLLGYSALNLVGMPVRGLFMASIIRAQALGQPLYESVESITASPAWQISKKVSLILYGWFVIGALWVLNSKGCPTCPGAYRMVIAIIAQSVVRAIVGLAAVKILFPEALEGAIGAVIAVQGASASQIESLPMVRFSSDSEPADCCAVCLADYGTGDLLRTLPCGHRFHCPCADRWLAQSMRCPLCIQAIDSAVKNDAGKAKSS